MKHYQKTFEVIHTSAVKKALTGFMMVRKIRDVNKTQRCFKTNERTKRNTPYEYWSQQYCYMLAAVNFDTTFLSLNRTVCKIQKTQTITAAPVTHIIFLCAHIFWCLLLLITENRMITIFIAFCVQNIV